LLYILRSVVALRPAKSKYKIQSHKHDAESLPKEKLYNLHLKKKLILGGR
jgi:hypothetical protein